MKTKRRIYVPEAALAADAEVVLHATQSHYLLNVLRLTPGADVHVFNAAHGEWLGELRSEKREARVILKHQTVSPLVSRVLPLTLAFAPLKKDRTDFLVEKASELGVHVLQPVFTDHTQSDRVNIERLQTTAIEAAEQCDRLDAPQVLAPLKLQDYLDACFRGNDAGDILLFLAAESGNALPIATAFSSLSSSGCEAIPGIHFLIGPEGGFSAAEFETFNRYPNIHRLRLGPRLLRAETAAVAVLSTFQAILGDW